MAQNIAGTTAGANVHLDNSILDVWSQEILYQAQPSLRFEGIAKMQTELGVTPGLTINFLRYNSLTGSSLLVETTEMTTDSLTTSTISITVAEHGKAIAVSELLLRSSFLKIMEQGSNLLGMHYAKDRDALCRDELLTSANILYSQAGGAAVDRAALTSDSVFDVDLVRDAVENLAVNKAPKFGGDAYVCFVHPHQARQIRENSAWLQWSQYAAPDQIFKGEIGRIEDVRFIETTHVTYVKQSTQNIWADRVDTGNDTSIAANAATDVYQAIVVGDYALGVAESLPVEMRDNGIEDFGRKHSLAYYGIWGAGLIEEGHVFVIETA